MYEDIKTFKDLSLAIEAELSQQRLETFDGDVDVSPSGAIWSSPSENDLYRAAIRIRTRLLRENPSAQLERPPEGLKPLLGYCSDGEIVELGGQEDSGDIEIDPATKEQQWREVAPEYIPNADAIRMGSNKISIDQLTKVLRKSGNTIRWMRNKKAKRSKVHAQDFLSFIRNLKETDIFSEAAFEAMEKRKEDIDQNKRDCR